LRGFPSSFVFIVTKFRVMHKKLGSYNYSNYFFGFWDTSFYSFIFLTVCP
jgi:hypothetical protein